MTIYVLPNHDAINKLGIVVSKKFSKSSVKRNRVKRLIKEIYRLNEEEICKGKSIVILWKKNVLYDKVSFENVYHDLFKCLKKANLLNKEEEFNA
ncbi:MAG: ribonuclease P protein component [Clostridia bacterium]|nr:ribonuclease P protein component [Clostridia bacterium]